MSGQVANVYKQGVLAARLERVGDDIKFSYLPDYLAAGLPEVATTLPLTSEPVLTSGGSAPAFFAGLLPEGRRLAAVASRLKISRDNDLGVLLEIGADLIGDTQVLPIDVDPLAERPPVLLPGDLAGVSQRFVYDLERGKPSVALDKVLLVCSTLGLRLALEVAN